MKAGILLVPVLWLAGCAARQQATVVVGVYPSRQQCGVRQEMMNCGEVAGYLRDTLKLDSPRDIAVSAVGSDPLPKEDRSLRTIADSIREAGFSNVRAVNFDVK